MTCCCCSTTLGAALFILVLERGSDDAIPAAEAGLCWRCGPHLEAASEKAVQIVQKIWPGLTDYDSTYRRHTSIDLCGHGFQIRGKVVGEGRTSIPRAHMTETPIEMERRHVSEGAERIARQEALIVELTRDGHAHMLPGAGSLLAQFRSLQLLSVEHLARLESAAGGA